jgi:hypothetical protein
MNAKQALTIFQQNGGTLTSEIRAVVAMPEGRHALYKVFLEQDALPFSEIIRECFQREIEFRNALWDGKATDDGTFSEGIFQCAFLIYRMGRTEDLPLLCQADHLNMDVGELDPMFFVGPGVTEAIAFFETSDIDDGKTYAASIRVFFANHQAMVQLKDWEDYMQSGIQNA